MTPEEKSLLERTNRLAEENNAILRGMRRSNRISMIFRAVYWLIIIAIAVGAAYYLQPYVDQMMNLYNKAEETINSVGGTVNQARSALNSISQ